MGRIFTLSGPQKPRVAGRVPIKAWSKDLDAKGGGPVMHPSIPEMQYEQKSQKAVDVGLSFHMVRSYHKRHWNKLVLAAGDSDFHEPVQSLVEGENVELYLVGSVNTISDQLRPYAKNFFEIDKEPLHSYLRLEQRYLCAGCSRAGEFECRKAVV
jgi:hypothetical protein